MTARVYDLAERRKPAERRYGVHMVADLVARVDAVAAEHAGDLLIPGDVLAAVADDVRATVAEAIADAYAGQTQEGTR